VSEVVLDASALLALMRNETGHEAVAAALPMSRISAVNLAEVLAKAFDYGIPVEESSRAVEALPVAVTPFTPEDAHLASSLRPATRPRGLSLGDRCCLALGLKTGLPVLTAEREWAGLDVGVTVRVIR
jgi:PIN domain nuclease of toxin-antitoxin system